MSRAQEPHRPFLPFGNPFRRISPKSSHLSPKLLSLLNNFEETLARRVRNLKPPGKEDILRLSWMRRAMESLCEIHTDVKTFITSLELPVSDWEDKWIDVYLDNSVKLLDICIAFTSEISRLKQGNLYLQCVAHNLKNHDASSNNVASLDGWKKHVDSKNKKIDKCFAMMDGLAQNMDLPKIKNSTKGKVLMRAMYGVKVVTLLICSIFGAGFSGSAEKLVDLKVSETFLWADAFGELRNFVNTEIRSLYSSGKVTVLKELEAVDSCVKKLYPVLDKGVEVESGNLLDLSLSFGKSAGNLSHGLDVLAKEVDGFFQIVLSGRGALLSNLRLNGNAFDGGHCK